MDSTNKAEKETISEKTESFKDYVSYSSGKSNKSGYVTSSIHSSKGSKSDASLKQNPSRESFKSDKTNSQDAIDADNEKNINDESALNCNSDGMVVHQMENFLKYGITDDGTKIMTTDNCTWYYDYYKSTKMPYPHHEKELTENTTVDYYYYTSPFNTQIGNINLVMMHSQVNFEDGTYTPTDRVFRNRPPTPEMIENAKLRCEQFKREGMDLQ